MNPLLLRVIMGLEDTRLEAHIAMLEAHKSGASGSAGFTESEECLLAALYARMEVITGP